MSWEKAIVICAKLYEARRRAIDLLGEEKFRKHVEQMRPILAAICKQDDCSELAATIKLMERMKEKFLSPTLALACCVEIMEPSLQAKD